MKIETYGTPLVTDHQSDVTSLTLDAHEPVSHPSHDVFIYMCADEYHERHRNLNIY